MLAITPINNRPCFKGLLEISKSDKKNEIIIVDTDKVSTISRNSFIGPKGDYTLFSGDKQEGVIIMDNGSYINTFLPVENVIEAYKQAKADGESKLETKIAPTITQPLFR